MFAALAAEGFQLVAARVPLSLSHLIGEKIARREHCVAIMQVFAALAAEGFQLAAARVPLSRERTPEAADLDTLLAQHALPPPGNQTFHL